MGLQTLDLLLFLLEHILTFEIIKFNRFDSTSKSTIRISNENKNKTPIEVNNILNLQINMPFNNSRIKQKPDPLFAFKLAATHLLKKTLFSCD